MRGALLGATSVLLATSILRTTAAIRRSPPGVPLEPTLRVISVLALLTAVGPISTDMYLPAFPAIRESLSGSQGQTQMTLAAWFLGLALGQVTYGPLADHYGRRLPLLTGIAIYTIASVGCAIAGSMTTLSFWRFVAAFGGAASLVIPRAIVRDLSSDGTRAVQLVGRLILVLGIVPMLAPTMGGLLELHLGWRSIFWVAGAYGIGCAVLTFRQLPETVTERGPRKLRLYPLLVHYNRVWRERSFKLHSAQGGFATFSLFVFLADAPSVFLSQLHVSPLVFSGTFIANAATYALGAQINARVVPRSTPSRVLSVATFAMLGCTLAMLAAVLLRVPFQAAAIAASFALMMGCLGFVLPGAAMGSVMIRSRDAGSASALYGTMVFGIGALGTVLAGLFADHSPIPMAGLMVAGAAIAVTIDRFRPGRKRRLPGGGGVRRRRRQRGPRDLPLVETIRSNAK